MIDQPEATANETFAGNHPANDEEDIVEAALGLIRRMPMEQRRRFDEAYSQNRWLYLGEHDEHGMPLELRREIDEFMAKPPPPAVSDAELEAILVDLPKHLDRTIARRELEAVWSMHLKGQPFRKSLGLDRTKGQQVEAQQKFVDTARAFLEAFTPQIDNLYEYLTHEFEAPRKDRRTPVIEEVSAMADFFEKVKDRSDVLHEQMSDNDQEATYQLRAGFLASEFAKSKYWLIMVLHCRFLELGGKGGKGSRKLHRFIANASAPVLGPDEKLTQGAVRDHPHFRNKRPKRPAKKRKPSGTPIGSPVGGHRRR